MLGVGTSGILPTSSFSLRWLPFFGELDNTHWGWWEIGKVSREGICAAIIYAVIDNFHMFYSKKIVNKEDYEIY